MVVHTKQLISTIYGLLTKDGVRQTAFKLASNRIWSLIRGRSTSDIFFLKIFLSSDLPVLGQLEHADYDENDFIEQRR